MPDAHKNFAYSTVLTPPSPATSGTTLVLASGGGALLPTAPFNMTVWPIATQPLSTNAEIVRVTNISGDTLTITRAQEGSSARSILVGDQIAATITALTLTQAEDIDGWISSPSETWTYASADAPTFTFTVAADVTTKYSAGMKVKLTQSSTVAYFIITAVSTFSGGNTTITIYGGTDYTLANAAISSPYFSMQRAPFGFPLSPAKWTVEVSDSTTRSQVTPGAGTWYNPGSISISVPIGCWNLSHLSSPQASDGSGSDWVARSTLSTANNSESDNDFTGQVYSGNNAQAISVSVYREKVISVAAKTPYYLNVSTPSSGLDTLLLRNDTSYGSKAIIRAVCAYL